MNKLSEDARSIDDYLIDNEISDKPISDLIYSPFNMPRLYLKQMILCSKHWTQDARLAVGSILVGQPLKAQGASDVRFVFSVREPLGDPEDEEQLPVIYISLVDPVVNNVGKIVCEFICVEIHGPWNADVNSPAKKAQERMGALGLKPELRWGLLYGFVRDIASGGLGTNLNAVAFSEPTNSVLQAIRKAEYDLCTRAIKVLNEFEGRDPSDEGTTIKTALDKRRMTEDRDTIQHRVWDDE